MASVPRTGFRVSKKLTAAPMLSALSPRTSPEAAGIRVESVAGWFQASASCSP
jgi:hypothetical protein